jgi:Gram-negative bacterial TonB protein C-terminal
MPNLLVFLAAAMLMQPSPSQNPPAAEISRLEALVTSGQAQCQDYRRLATLYHGRGDFDLGLTTVRTCITLAPDDPRSYHAVADYLTEEAHSLRSRALSLERPDAGAPAQQLPDCRAVLRSPPGAAQPVRVGGPIKAPSKTKHVNPVYPPIAQSARVQGVIILEVVVGTNGSVDNACVCARFRCSIRQRLTPFVSGSSSRRS